MISGERKRTNSMRRDVKKDWAWADEYLPAVKQILEENAMHFISIKIAPLSDDLERATDMVLTLTGGDVAVRIRRDNCAYRDLTIRAWRKGDIETEIHKIRKGFARWYFYAWTKKNKSIGDWIIVDLDKMRQLDLFDDNRSTIKNPDGRTGFVAYSKDELSKNGCLIAKGKYSVAEGF